MFTPTMKNRIRLLCCLLLALMLQGCSQWFYTLGRPLSAADAPDPVKQPMVSDVMASLGPPQRMSATASGYVMAWEHWDIREQSLGIRLGAAGADIFSVDYGSARAKGTFLLANFSHEHRLQGSAIARWDSDAGSGKGVQPLFGIVSVVDVGDLLRDMPQHWWGGTSLGRLPHTLNVGSDPNSGQAGIEQRGTPRAIGQNSLDFR
jgi:hypothetical protein